MKNKLRICSIILIAISITLISIVLNENMEMAYCEPITSNDYEYLKECATKVAQTFDTEVSEDDSVEATYSISEDEKAVYINVKLIKHDTVKCKLTAKYPTEYIYKNFDIENNDVNMNLSFKLNYDEVTYTKINCIPSIREIIAMGTIWGGIAFFLLYCFTNNEK